MYWDTASTTASYPDIGAAHRADPACAVAAILDRPDAELDYLEAKLALDTLIDPSLDTDSARTGVERLAREARRLCGPKADLAQKLSAVRTVLYESGLWNDHRPYAYDQSDPDGERLRNKLLVNYVATRRGQCVSMPILFLIVGERLGIDLSLACAPGHVFVRHRLEDGRTANIETTSGGHPARADWFRHNFPMSDRALQSGLYMRSLSRREAVALMASTILEWLRAEQRFDELIAVADVILRHNSRDAMTIVMQGSAYGTLLDGLRQRCPDASLASAQSRLKCLSLLERNRSLIAAAEAMGWVPNQQHEEGIE